MLGKPIPNFNKDLFREKPNEIVFGELICNTVGGSGLHFCSNSAYDFGFIWNDRLLRYELKTDYRSRDTNNFFCETGNARTGRPSCLAVSEADRYVVYLPHLSLLLSFSTPQLFQFAQTGNFEGKTTANSKGPTIPLPQLTGGAIPFKAIHLN